MTSSRKILSEQQPSDSRKDRGSNRGSRRNEEPEWMSAPINQDDMMELKGFDDSPEKEAKSKLSFTRTYMLRGYILATLSGR